MTGKIKHMLLLNLPYVLIALLATKLGEAWRYSPGLDISQKVLHLMDGFALSFQSPWPSLLPQDLILGIVIAGGIKLAVYVKGRNAKKYRKNIEYGSARWGRPEDIKPFIDPTFRNNVILTETERLTMNNRPKDPRLARNKNVMVVGGSGSGKTRFWLKPNLMQCHSSYVVTDPIWKERMSWFPGALDILWSSLQRMSTTSALANGASRICRSFRSPGNTRCPRTSRSNSRS